ncbi:ABC transporter substrate-binding protein [soil metagenome]
MAKESVDQIAYDRLLRQAITGQMSRRTLLKRASVLGLSAGLTTSLLAACGDDEDEPTAVTGGGGATPEAPGETAETDTDETPETAEDETPEAAGEETPDAAGEPAVEGVAGGTLILALNSDCTTMDPHRSTAAVDRQVYQLVYDKLVDIDEGLNIVPELASEWVISDDGLEYTFTLVEGVTFHDGEPFNAEAAKFNFDRMLDEATASPRRSEITQITAVEAVDELTLMLTLSQPFSPLLATLSDRAGMMISPAAVEELGDDLARNPVGTGAFSFVEWIEDDHLTLTRNDSWWQEGLPYLDEVRYIPITDASVRLTALRTNDVQMIDQVSARDVAQAREDPDLVYDEVAGLGFTYISLHSSNPPFDNMALRQAVAWTLDREAINETLFFGTGSAAQTPIPPSSWAYDESVQIYTQDYDMARQKLEEGGMPDGFEFTMLVTNTPDGVQLAEAYRAMIGEAGIVANIELLEFGTLLDRSNAGDYQAVSLGWSGRPDPDGNIYGYFHSEGGLNRGSYSNPEVDELLDQTRAVSDQDERRALYSELLTIVAEEAPMIFVRFPAEIKIWQPVIEGFMHVPDGMMRMDGVSRTDG